MVFIQELCLTAFLVLVLSYIVAKLVSISLQSTSEEKVLDKKIGQEEVKLDKGLKVVGTKSKRKRVKFVDDVVVRNIDRFEVSEEPIKDFELSEKVGFLEKSVEGGVTVERGEETKIIGSVYGFEGEGVDKESELMLCDEKLYKECRDVNMIREVKGADAEGEGSKDVGLLDEALYREVIDEKKEAAKISELCGVKEEEEVASGLEGLVVGEEIRTDEIGGENGLILMNVDLESDLIAAAAGERVTDNAEICEFSGDHVTSDLEGLLVGEEIKTDGISDDNGLKLINDDVVSDQRDAAGGERATYNAEILDKALEGEAVEEKSDSAIDKEKIYGGKQSNIQIVSGGLENLSVKEKMKSEDLGGESEVEFASDDTAIHRNEGGVFSVNEAADVIVTEEGSSKENEGEEGILRDENFGDSDDDDWEGVERSELEKVFAEAVNYVEYGGKTKGDQLVSLGSDVQMQLYGLHKLALEGPCHEPQPMALKVSARAKWNAWQRLGSTSPEVAMEEYIKILSDRDPGWMQHSSAEDDIHGSFETGVSDGPDTKLSFLQDPQANLKFEGNWK